MDVIEELAMPTRRSFLGWTAAIAGCTLLTRPALAVPVWRTLVSPHSNRIMLIVEHVDSPRFGEWVDRPDGWRQIDVALAGSAQ